MTRAESRLACGQGPPTANCSATIVCWHATCASDDGQVALRSGALVQRRFALIARWRAQQSSEFREVRNMATSKRGPEPGSQKAKHGGQAVREKYGPEFYSKIGKKGGEAVKEKLGPSFYAEIGKKGGESTKRQQGPEFYSRIGKKGGERGRGTPKQQARDRAAAQQRP